MLCETSYSIPHLPGLGTDCVFWDLPDHVLAAPISAKCGWNGVELTRSSFFRGKYHCIT